MLKNTIRSSGLGVGLFAVAISSLVGLSFQLQAQVFNNQTCWNVVGNTCNAEQGDCAFRDNGKPCNKCKSPAELASACIFREDDTCTVLPQVPINCGALIKGKCDDLTGFCDGNMQTNSTCLIGVCDESAT